MEKKKKKECCYIATGVRGGGTGRREHASFTMETTSTVGGQWADSSGAPLSSIVRTRMTQNVSYRTATYNRRKEGKNRKGEDDRKQEENEKREKVREKQHGERRKLRE